MTNMFEKLGREKPSLLPPTPLAVTFDLGSRSLSPSHQSPHTGRALCLGVHTHTHAQLERFRVCLTLLLQFYSQRRGLICVRLCIFFIINNSIIINNNSIIILL